MFSRTESLEQETVQMQELAARLAAIPRTRDAKLRQEARQLISKLNTMNQRWNMDGMREFLIRKQKEILY